MKHSKIWIFLVLVIAISGCADQRRADTQRRNVDKDRIECSAAGGVYVQSIRTYPGICFAIDSVISLTGPREGYAKTIEQ